jgi:hypothetical protein
MKCKILISIFLTICLVAVFAVPVSASTGTKYNVDGIEISAGSYSNGYTIGATFTAAAIQTPFPLSTGLLCTSVNYQGTVPTEPGGSNTIVGGTWSLKVTTGKVKGTISGEITGGQIVWATYKNMLNTGRGTATIALSITGGTGGFSGISGTGTFNGYDTHASGIWITLGTTKIQVPTLKGTLTLN